jgi:hypothetical protein
MEWRPIAFSSRCALNTRALEWLLGERHRISILAELGRLLVSGEPEGGIIEIALTMCAERPKVKRGEAIIRAARLGRLR